MKAASLKPQVVLRVPAAAAKSALQDEAREAKITVSALVLAALEIARQSPAWGPTLAALAKTVSPHGPPPGKHSRDPAKRLSAKG